MRVNPCRGVVLLVSVQGHGKATHDFGIARMRPGRLFGLLDLRANRGEEIGGIEACQFETAARRPA